MLPGLCRGDGSFDFSAADSIFNTYSIPSGQRPILMDRVIVCIAAIEELRAAEAKKKPRNR